MTQSELLRYVVGVLERMKLKYFVTGSLASTAYGEARLTHDIDIVLQLPPTRVREFCVAFGADEFYVSEEAVRVEAARGGQCNVIHPASGLKIDLIFPSADELNTSRFSRIRRLVATPGVEAWFSSPEDIILKKMEFYREGGSEKHLRDITGILKVSGEEVDREYVREWARKLGVEEIWDAIERRLGLKE
jgi:hypothetical protein